jgi:hypothetical protein
VVAMWLRNDLDDGCVMPIAVGVYARTDDAAAPWKKVVFASDGRAAGLSSDRTVVTCAMPANETGSNSNDNWNDNNWHYFEADVTAALRTAVPGAKLAGEGIVGIEFEVSGTIVVKDMVVSGGKCRRSYSEIPGAAICGVLGSWTGPNVDKDNDNAVRYFHYNDLGTVLAQTKAASVGSGAAIVEGVWEPDFFGNYCAEDGSATRWAYAGSPARPELGLTGKMWDGVAGMNYVNARWGDTERGRFAAQTKLHIC